MLAGRRNRAFSASVLAAPFGCNATCLVSPTSAALSPGRVRAESAKLSVIRAKPIEDVRPKRSGRMFDPRSINEGRQSLEKVAAHGHSVCNKRSESKKTRLRISLRCNKWHPVLIRVESANESPIESTGL